MHDRVVIEPHQQPQGIIPGAENSRCDVVRTIAEFVWRAVAILASDKSYSLPADDGSGDQRPRQSAYTSDVAVHQPAAFGALVRGGGNGKDRDERVFTLEHSAANGADWSALVPAARDRLLKLHCSRCFHE
jgi:hypothetical protein